MPKKIFQEKNNTKKIPQVPGSVTPGLILTVREKTLHAGLSDIGWTCCDHELAVQNSTPVCTAGAGFVGGVQGARRAFSYDCKNNGTTLGTTFLSTRQLLY